MHALARGLFVITLAGLLMGGSCQVSYCSSDCNPCETECRCPTHPCNDHAGDDVAAAHALEHYDFRVRADPSGAIARVYANVLGLSLERLHGPGPVATTQYVEFTHDVLRMNPELFGETSARMAWSLDGMERYGERVLVRWRRSASGGRGAESSVLCLFDEHANLIEIDHEVRLPLGVEPRAR